MNLVESDLPVPIPADLADKKPELVSQGAEALLLKISPTEIVKYRPAKSWRLPLLDKQLRKRRTKQESTVMEKLYTKGISVPKLLRSDPVNGLIFMEFVEGESLKKFTWDNESLTTEVKKMYEEYGELVAKIHNLHICHGDLTTSNAMVRDNKLVLIDFGLSQQQGSVEDKAVDLYVLERAIQSTHPLESAQLTNEVFMPAYIRTAESLSDKFLSDVLERLQTVRQRGRKRTQLG